MTFRDVLKTVLLAVVLSVSSPFSFAQEAATTTVVDEKDLFKYLDQSIIWYRHVTTAESSDISSREMLLRRSLQQSGLKALRYSFDFARIQADILQQAEEQAAEGEKNQTAAVPAEDGEKPQEGEEPKFNPVQAKINIAARIDTLNKEIAQNANDVARASRANRPALTAKRDKLAAELNLAKTQGNLIDAVLTMSAAEKEETVSGQIDNLAKAIPELAVSKKKTTETAPATATPAAAASQDISISQATQLLTTGTMTPPDVTAELPAESKGVIGLISELITRNHQKQDLADLLDETTTMQKANEAKINEQRERLLEIVRRSKDISEQNDNTATDTLVQQGAELSTLNDDFKNVSDIIVPLSKQRMSLRNAAQTIENWQGIFSDEMSQIARRLLTRLVTLIIMIAVPFGLSELARRFLSQYIADARRRRQLNIMRRIIVGIIVGLIVLFNLVSEFGSMATFIGFVTAGLAVALQNVILSIVAYFFFFGRFGIKVGSRVSVGVVTGDVIETGFVRLYLMELVEEKGQFRPTGRIVAFPNSILFQPTAFFKQVPGVGYRWHEMTYTLESETERALAETKLREIIDSVYKDNKGMIDMQKAAMEQSTRLRVKEPRPDGKVEKTPDGLNITIRYPVDTEAAETTDKNVMRIAKEVFERLPNVAMSSDEPPAIKRK